MRTSGSRVLLALIAIVDAVSCASEPSLRCGPGTHRFSNECLPDRAGDSAGAAITATSSDPPLAKAMQLGDPIVVDGIELTLTGPIIGPLPRQQARRQLFQVPDGDFLQLTASLRNVTEARIVVAHDLWDDTLLVDEHGNRMPTVTAVAMRPAVDDLEPSGELRPGSTVVGLLVFPPPIDAASTFDLVSDPGLYAREDAMLLRPLSETRFTLRFDRAVITSSRK